MELERGNGSSKQIINNCSIEKKSEHNADEDTDGSLDRDLSNSDTAKEASTLKHPSFNSSLSLKLPSSDSTSSLSSPSTISPSHDEVLQDNKIKESFNARKSSTLPISRNDENGASRNNKSSISTEPVAGSLEPLTFPVADLTYQSYQPHLSSIVRSPPMQVMDRGGGGYDPFRIPSAIFERNISTAPVEWSVASNESLFSLKLGSASCSGDRMLLTEIKPGDQLVLSHSFSVVDRDNQPSVPPEETSEKPMEMRNKKKKSNEISPIEMEKKETINTTTVDEIKEIDGDEDDNDDNYGDNKNEKNEGNKTTSIVSWTSATISRKTDASEISKKSYTNGDCARKKKNKWACSSFYCSNCSLAFCYCRSPMNCCKFNCARCYCSNCTWVLCYCWDCTKKRWCFCGCCQPSTILPDELKSGPPKVIAAAQPSSACETSAKSTSCNGRNCFSCCSLNIFSCRSCSRSSYHPCSHSSCRPCSGSCSCSCFSCRSCRRCSSSCWPSSCFSSCRSIRCSSCSISSCWPSSSCSSCHFCSSCSFSCSSCCPCSSISCRPFCCSSCSPWSCSCHRWRCSRRPGRCCCCGGTDNYCSCLRLDNNY